METQAILVTQRTQTRHPRVWVGLLLQEWMLHRRTLAWGMIAIITLISSIQLIQMFVYESGGKAWLVWSRQFSVFINGATFVPFVGLILWENETDLAHEESALTLPVTRMQRFWLLLVLGGCATGLLQLPFTVLALSWRPDRTVPGFLELLQACIPDLLVAFCCLSLGWLAAIMWRSGSRWLLLLVLAVSPRLVYAGVEGLTALAPIAIGPAVDFGLLALTPLAMIALSFYIYTRREIRSSADH